MMVLFDLPVRSKRQRKRAVRFRNVLLDNGFEMAQFSVYLRFCASKEIFDTYTRRVRSSVPEQGSVHVIGFTDKQYEKMLCFQGGVADSQRQKPRQYELF